MRISPTSFGPSFGSRGRLLLAAGLGFALAGCAKNPARVGQETAKLRCACATQKNELTYERNAKLAKRLTDRAITSKEQLYQELAAADQTIGRGDSACQAKANAVLVQGQLDFAQETDRQTMNNEADTAYKHCTDELEAKNRTRQPADLSELAKDLPYALPAAP